MPYNDAYLSLLPRLEAIGLPTSYLRLIAQRYDIEDLLNQPGGSTAASASTEDLDAVPSLNPFAGLTSVAAPFGDMSLERLRVRPCIYFSRHDLDFMRTWSQHTQTVSGNDTVAVNNIYHEGTHALLNIRWDNPQYARERESYAASFANVRLDNGQHPSDLSGFMHECAGEYVGAKVERYFTTWFQLQRTRERHLARPELDASIERLRGRYEAREQFGYDPGGQSNGISRPRAVEGGYPTPELRSFLDSEVLERKIPDRFGEVPAFRALVSGCYRDLEHPTPPAQRLCRNLPVHVTLPRPLQF